MDNNNMQAQQMRLQQYLAANQPELLESLAELVKSREEALSSSQMKSEFLANMSHEIRTPLHGIVGTTDLLMETAENKEQLELLQTLKISNETLLHVINDVLDFSKVEHGQLKLEKRSFELADICDLRQRCAVISRHRTGQATRTNQ
jgi:signal transduction histidine kinase